MGTSTADLRDVTLSCRYDVCNAGSISWILNEKIERAGWLDRLKIAQKFERFLDEYRRADGQRWGGQELEKVTSGAVTRSYVSALRKGKIVNPGYEKLLAIARAMGFPPELWFGDAPDASVAGERKEGDIAGRLERLFRVIPNERTRKPYTNAELARASLGDISEEEVGGIRDGRITNPTVAQVLALSEVFGIAPSYFLDKGKKAPLLDEETMKVVGDRSSLAIANKSLGLSEGEKELVVDMIERLGSLHRSENR